MARRRRTRMSASATDDLVAGGLVSTEWLAARLDDPRVKVLDGTYHLPTAARDGDAEFLERHIPGAARFDIDDVCDPGDSLPHMIPSPERRSEEHTSELQSLMRLSSAVFCLKKKTAHADAHSIHQI